MPSRRFVLMGLAALPIAAAATRALAVPAPDTIPTAAGDLVIQPLNHATLILSQGSHVLYIDPAKVDFSGQKPPTGILVTHAHGDHFDPDNLLKIAGKAPIVVTAEVMGKLPAALKAQATVMNNGDTGTIDGIPVSAVPAYNISPDKLQYHPKGVGNGYVLTFGDRKVYVAGDTENIPEMAALTGIDVAFLPMNQPYTMTPEQAAAAVKAFGPRIVYPYHYKGTDPQKFAALVGTTAEVRLRDWYS